MDVSEFNFESRTNPRELKRAYEIVQKLQVLRPFDHNDHMNRGRPTFRVEFSVCRAHSETLDTIIVPLTLRVGYS